MRDLGSEVLRCVAHVYACAYDQILGHLHQLPAIENQVVGPFDSWADACGAFYGAAHCDGGHACHTHQVRRGQLWPEKNGEIDAFAGRRLESSGHAAPSGGLVVGNSYCAMRRTG